MFSKLKIGLLALVLVLPADRLLAQAQTLTNAVGMEFVHIKPGSMVVGRYQPTVGEYRPPVARPGAPAPKVLPPEAYDVARKMAAAAAMPGFTVKIERPYYIGRFEVTQEQWEKVMGRNPSLFQGARVSGDARKHPVENVTWKQAQAFVRKLNKLDAKYVYRLPSEFELEYAPRAGAPDDIPWPQARAQGVISDATTRPVGSKEPNAWGVYDMIGNVWEWVADHYNGQLFAGPVPPRSGKQHVLKGASFTGDAKNATYMTHAAGPGNGFDVGLRVLMEIR